MMTSTFRAPFSVFDASVDIRVKQLEEDLSTMLTSLVCGLHQLLDLKDLNTGVHSTRLAEWGMRLGQELGIEDHRLREIEIAAVVHDIGKIGVSESILNKPAKLTEEERIAINKHPEFGWGVLHLFPQLQEASLITLHHHENMDGTGYPGKLRGSEIPIGARIVTVIDAFDAMVSNRPYRKGLPADEAKRRLILGCETQFDSSVVQCFLRIVDHELPTVFAATGTDMNVVF